MLNISISSSHYGNNFLLHQQSKWPRFFLQYKKKKEVISNTNPFRRENALNPMENSWILFCLSLVSNLSGNTGMTHAEETLALYLCRSYNSGTTLRSTLEQQTRTRRTVFQTGRGGGKEKRTGLYFFLFYLGFFNSWGDWYDPRLLSIQHRLLKSFRKLNPLTKMLKISFFFFIKNSSSMVPRNPTLKRLQLQGI